ncbi:hypothetical protein QBC41DRAFT_62188 [Cercophora samala]|uniref:RING-type E3 ubiquitin transferase n=1 Tax=Cercophora samala TaxID=330535 RepID=A0AA39ZHG8_9PEZI|nr:hypothetical protein QBC41DRAFT_62188 [Cercophora samala]
MASFGMGPRRHLDADAGREVVYCHSCANEWYSDEQPPRLEPECPRCHSDIVEIVEPGESDPRIEAGGGLGTYPAGLGGGGSGSYFRRNTAGNDSDPEEDDIENHFPGGPARSPFGGLFPPTPGAPGRDNNRPGDEVFNRFFEMVMHDLGGVRAVRESQGANSPGGGAPSPSSPGRHVHSATFTFVSGPGVRPDQPPPMIPLFGPYARSPPRHHHHHSGPHRTVTFVTGGNVANGDPLNRMLAQVLGIPNVGGHQEQGQPGNRAAGPPPMGGGVLGLQQLLSTILNPAAAVHGDAVFTQEALDRIITQLMENSPQTNAAPPASESAIESLEKKKVDAELLGPEGKAECTICIDEFKLGDEVTVLPCSHWYHGECVVLWLKEHNTCPICRKPIENREENRAGNHSGQRSPGADQAASSSSQAQQPQQSSNEAPRMFTTFLPRDTATRPDEGASASTTGYQIPSLFSSYTSRVRTPQENQERLERIRNMAGGGQRRSSASPPGAWPEDDAAESRSSRQRSPSRPRDDGWGGNSGSGTPGESNRRSYFSSFTSAGRDQQPPQQQQREGSSSSSNNNNNNGNGGSSGGSSNPFTWIRDHLSRDRNNGNGNGGRR